VSVIELSASAPGFIRREARRPETQELIYQAAVRLFREQGYHATSIRNIATAVDIQPATIYHYFRNKEAILYSIMERVLTDLLAIQQRLANPEAGPVEQLREMVRAHVHFHCEHALEAFVADNELRGLSGDLYDRIIAYRDRYQAMFRQVIEEGVRQDVFRVPDVRVATNILLVMATGAVTWFCPGGRLSLEEIADIHATLALKGVIAPEKSKQYT